MPKETKRHKDINGYMQVVDNPISKVGVFDYLGSEIAGHDLDGSAIFGVYRPDEELSNQDTIDSFKLMPFIDDHEILGDNAMAPEKKGIQGYIGESVYFDSPFLRGNIMIPSRAAQSAIDSGKIELSPAYRCVYEKKDGVFDGKAYQFIQRNIRANHLALVAEGRTGPDVAVLDHRTITIDSSRLKPMEFTPEQLAQIKALIMEVMAAAAATDAPKEEPAKTAEDAPADVPASEDADPKTEPTAEDATKAAMDGLRAEIAKLRAEQVKPITADAMMSMIADRDSLAKSVSHFVGTFEHSSMTADGVAKYACEKIGLKPASGTERIALDAWLHGRKPESATVVAQDSRASTGSSVETLWSKK